MALSEGQMSDYKGAALMLDALPKAKTLLGDRGYDADWFRAALADRKITACIPSAVLLTVIEALAEPRGDQQPIHHLMSDTLALAIACHVN